MHGCLCFMPHDAKTKPLSIFIKAEFALNGTRYVRMRPGMIHSRLDMSARGLYMKHCHLSSSFLLSPRPPPSRSYASLFHPATPLPIFASQIFLPLDVPCAKPSHPTPSLTKATRKALMRNERRLTMKKSLGSSRMELRTTKLER